VIGWNLADLIEEDPASIQLCRWIRSYVDVLL